ncbi:flagellar type III secretion system pore protein FliP [Athalassotoga saccharophila]|uniref:flagellar type III secretion system pore protein FliP n=1 Tax=Athalassotoga saccharophila TaxID=1441386 RepID=UPI00137A4C4A|nr:flagellar type III secretion system pore protein FliP [Athalassotoga saccharophila]BBJ27966.1 flagellar biosynthetic protein FliP [Athalassotoga saccharophila]
MKKIILLIFFLFLLSSAIFAQTAPTPPSLPSLTITIGGTPTSSQLSTTLIVLLIITVISLAPSILILMTSFTRIIVVFSLLRSAMATQQSPPNQILVGLALFMTFFIMQPTFTKAYEDGLVPYMNGKIGYQQAIKDGLEPFREFMYSEIVKHKDQSSILIFTSYRNMPAPKSLSDVPTSILIPAFVLSELKIAFKIGVLLYIPFILIDMIVASILLSLGMIMIPPVMISLPFKLLLFVLVDGWNLVVSGILHSF